MAAADVVRAPGGWGYRPGALLVADDAAILASLPPLPLLERACHGDGTERNRIVREALAREPDLIPHLQPRHLRKAYGVPHVSAYTIVAKLRGCGT